MSMILEGVYFRMLRAEFETIKAIFVCSLTQNYYYIKKFHDARGGMWYAHVKNLIAQFHPTERAILHLIFSI